MGAVIALLVFVFMGYGLGQGAKELFRAGRTVAPLFLAVVSVLAWVGAGFLGAFLIASSI